MIESCGVPREGSGFYRLGDSDDLVLMESVSVMPPETFYSETHGIIILCTSGWAQLEYDGVVVRLEQNDLFLYMRNSVASRFLLSSDFNCRMIWFTRARLLDMYRLSQTNLEDVAKVIQQPVLHITEEDVSLLETYFRLLAGRLKDRSAVLYEDIAHSLFGTMLLEIQSMLRRTREETVEPDGGGNISLHKKQLVDRFISLVEQSDGRIRRVDEFASQMNITPKYLSITLKEVLNRRPSAFIQLVAMKAIEYRLRYTDMTMQEIANDLNFANPSFFGKYFKEHTGMSPLEYRTKYYGERLTVEK